MATPCQSAVSHAIGREITDAEFAKVQGDIEAKLRQLWRQEPDMMRSMSKADSQRYAAARAMDDLVNDAQLKKTRLAISIARQADNMAYLRSRGMTFGAFNDMVAFGSSLENGGPGRVSVESEGRAIAEMAKSDLLDLIEAGNGRYFGFVESPEQVRDFMRALWGESAQDPGMAKAAASWKKVTDELRERFNRAGGDVGNLGDLWHLPQSHDALRIAKAGADDWINQVLPRLDRRQYVNADGSPMSEHQLRDMLAEVHLSITTDGANRRISGSPRGRGGMRANRHKEARALFFRDADSYLEYARTFGNGNIYSTLFGHIDTMAKDIALLETFGPNAEANARVLIDEINNAQAMANPVAAASKVNDAARWRANAIFDEVAGIGQGPASGTWASRLAAMRSWATAAKLGSAVLSSFSDHATMVMTSRMWNLPEMQVYRNYMKTLNPANIDEKRFLQRQGLAINAFAASMDRFSGDYGGTRSHKVANAVMRASGLTAVTAARQRAFSAAMMSSLGHLVKTKAWAELEAGDLKLLNAKGITSDIYAIWQKAELQTSPDYDGGLLSGRAIMDIPNNAVPIAQRQRAATQLMGMVLEEQNMAVIEAGARDRAMIFAGTKKGTFGGELVRSIMQFKTFPFAMMSRHWVRAMSAPTAGGKIGQMAALMALSTITGALAMEVKAIIDGKDPRALWDDSKPDRLAATWWAANLQGGGLGIFGDFLTDTANRGGSDFMSTMAGPMLGTIGDMVNLTIGNMVRGAQGEKTDVGADTMRLIKGWTPGASLWYGKTALNNIVFANLQEMANPGYLSRQRRRTFSTTGQEYWWRPGDLTPDRHPNLGSVAGQQ